MVGEKTRFQHSRQRLESVGYRAPKKNGPNGTRINNKQENFTKRNDVCLVQVLLKLSNQE